MRVLITGAGGQLGSELVGVCAAAGDDVLPFDHGSLDVTDRDAVLATVTALRPDAVVHCAAWTDVDGCETDPVRAHVANSAAVRWVAEACDRADAHLVHLSTDYVFDGALDRPYHEWDTPHPRSVYGRAKLAGEREAEALGASAAVVRTSWLCGERGSNIVKTVLRLAVQQDSLSFVDDQRGCPTFTADLAPIVRRIAVDRRSGVHHVTNDGPVTWYEFARDIVSAAGGDPAIVIPITTADLDPPRPAPRPANSVLDNAVLRAAGVRLLRDFRAPLAELVAALQGGG